jgi:hypothetical protein
VEPNPWEVLNLELGLLWTFLVFCFIVAAITLSIELHRDESEVKVILLFLEDNEENVEAILRTICRKTKGGNGGIRIIFIDNCSKDATVSIVSRLKHYFPYIDLLDRNDPQSQESCCLELMQSSVFKVIDFRDFSLPPLW